MIWLGLDRLVRRPHSAAFWLPSFAMPGCRLCGRQGHNYLTCQIQGAAEYRALKKGANGSASRGKSRTCRGTGFAALRKVKKPAMKRPAASKSTRRKECSGDVLCAGDRRDRQWSGPQVAGVTNEEALKHLLASRLLQRPARCDSCHGYLCGPYPRKDIVSQQLYWHCTNEDCRSRINVLSCNNWLNRDGVEKHNRALTPLHLFIIVISYFSETNPRPSKPAKIAKINEHLCILVFQKLRGLEARQGRLQLEQLRLKGQIEVDATTIRKLHISKSNPSWAVPIRAWQERHGQQALPPWFDVHVRIGGAKERGSTGKILMSPLPYVLLKPSARPPTESSLDVMSSDLISKVRPGATVYGDGARSWRSACEDAGLEFFQVRHCLMEFSCHFCTGGRAKVAGTQALDSCWRRLKEYLPREVQAKHVGSKLVNPALHEYVFSWQWRMNAGKDLWAALPSLNP